MIKKTIPKDLSKIRSKVLFNLTKRQLICFAPAVAIGVPLFFLTKGALGNMAAMLIMILIMMPFFLLAMYEHNGEHLEVYLKHLVLTKFIRDQYRPYKVKNFYSLLEKEAKVNREVRKIVKRSKKK